MKRSSIRGLLEALFANIVQTLLLFLGFSLGGTGYALIFQTAFKNLPNLTSILVGVTQFPVSIYFFVLTFRQVFPNGWLEYNTSSQQTTFNKRMQDFPIFFMLGVFAGLAVNALIIIIQNIIRLRP